MGRKTKAWLIIAISLVLLGCVIFSGVITMFKWDFTKLSTVQYETNAYEISESFDNISINTDTADIIFIPSNDEKCRVVCYEEKNAKHSAVISDNALTISMINEKKWYEYIGINFGTPKITIYLPQSEYASLFMKASTGDVEMPKDFKFEDINITLSTGDVKNYASASRDIKIKTSTGDIRVENVRAGAMDFSVSTGKVIVESVKIDGDINVSVSTGDARLTDIACKSVISTGNTGHISLKNVIAKEKFSLERSTGDIKFENSDAETINIKTDTGDVTGTLLSEKIFITETSTGNISVPKTTTGGKCEVVTDTGDIKFEISKK